MIISRKILFFGIATALIIVGFTVGYYIQEWRISNLNQKLNESEEKLRDVLSIPTTINIITPNQITAGQITPIDIYVLNNLGEGISNLNVSIILTMGEDIKTTSPTTDLGNGKYQAQLNISFAGTYEIVALIENYGISAVSQLYVESGPSSSVEFVDIEAQEGISRALTVWGRAVDPFGNTVATSKTNLTLSVIPNTIFTTSIEDNHHKFVLEPYSTGEYTLTLTDDYGIQTSTTISLDWIYLDIPEFAAEGSYISAMVNVFIPYNWTPLGHYDLNITYNSSILEPINIANGDPLDSIPAPNYEIGMDYLRIYQTLRASEAKNGFISLANVTFRVAGEGITNVSVFPSAGSGGLLDLNGDPYPMEKFPSRRVNSAVRTKTIKLKIWKVEGDVADSKISNDLRRLKAIYHQIEVKLGVKLVWDIHYNTISRDEWKNIDKDGDGRLDEYTRGRNNPTDEEKALLGNHFLSDRINVYYIGKFDVGNRGSRTTGEEVAYPAKNRHAVVVSGQTSYPNTLAHELGHYFGLGHVNEKYNLMYPYATSHKYKLTKSQCETILNGIRSLVSVIDLLPALKCGES